MQTSLIKKAKVLAPENPSSPTALFGGESSGILNWNDIKYPHFYEIYTSIRDNFWTPSVVNMQDDVKTIGKLTDEEWTAFKRIISLLASLDGPQTLTALLLSQHASEPSVRAILAIISSQEAIHNESYSYILSSLVNTQEEREIFDLSRTDPVLLERNKRIMDVYNAFVDNPTKENFMKTVVYSAILEGLYFYSGFAFFYNLARNEKMVKTSTMISYINADELEHGRFIAELFRGMMAEHSELNTEEFADFVYDAFDHAVESEIEWSHYVLGKIDGIDLIEMEGFIRYRANKMLRLFGYSNLYEGYEENPMKWLNAFVDNFDDTKSDFFEQRPRTYNKVSVLNGFDDL